MILSLHKPGNSFRYYQQVFTQHMRDPDSRPAPDDIEDRRLEIYRNALYLNIERMVANFFPVLKKTMTTDHWHAMVRDYFREHRAHIPPYLPRIGQEFLLYLENERDRSNDPDYILELAHYEWIEFALSIDTREIDFATTDPAGDLLDGVPVLSPLAIPLSYQYPVHMLSNNPEPGTTIQPLPTYIVVYRDRNYKTGFIELNPVSARLLELLGRDEDIPGKKLLEIIAQEMRHPKPEVVISGGLQVMQDLRNRDILVGVKK